MTIVDRLQTNRHPPSRQRAQRVPLRHSAAVRASVAAGARAAARGSSCRRRGRRSRSARRPRRACRRSASDAAGRWQYVYHPTHVRRREESKFERMLEFGRALPQLRRAVARICAQPGLGRRTVLACVVRILASCFLRPGSEEYADANGTFGLATLRREHVSVRRRRASASSSRARPASCSRASCAMRASRASSRVCSSCRAGRSSSSSPTTARSSTSARSHLNQYLKEAMGHRFSAKDFRTWAGTLICACALSRAGVVEDESTTARRARSSSAAVRETAGQSRQHARGLPLVVHLARGGRELPSWPGDRRRDRRRRAGARAGRGDGAAPLRARAARAARTCERGAQRAPRGVRRTCSRASADRLGSALMRAVRAPGALVVTTLLLAGCAPGVPPPGPIDIVREIFDPGYDYTQSPDTWRDARPVPPPRDDAWSSPCRERDLSCSPRRRHRLLLAARPLLCGRDRPVLLQRRVRRPRRRLLRRLKKPQGRLIDGRGDRRAEAVVDVHDRHAGGARVQHREQRREPAEARRRSRRWSAPRSPGGRRGRRPRSAARPPCPRRRSSTVGAHAAAPCARAGGAGRRRRRRTGARPGRRSARACAPPPRRPARRWCRRRRPAPCRASRRRGRSTVRIAVRDTGS